MIKRKIRSRKIELPECLCDRADNCIYRDEYIFSRIFEICKSKRLYFLNWLNTFVLSPVWVLIILHVTTCAQRDLHLFPFFWMSLLPYLSPSSLSLSSSLSSSSSLSLSLFVHPAEFRTVRLRIDSWESSEGVIERERV